jgi:hypothetical protein
VNGKERTSGGGTQNGERHARSRSAGMLLAWIFFLAVSLLTLNLPDHPDALTVASFLRLPVEVPLIALLLVTLRGHLAAVFRWLVTALLGIILFLKLADIGTQSAFQRPFNPYLDGKMLVDGWNLLSGAIGTGVAAGSLVILLFSCLAFLVLSLHSLRTVANTPSPQRERLRAAVAAVAVAVVVAAALPLRLPFAVEAGALPYLTSRTTLIATSISDMAAFERQLLAPSQAREPAPDFANVTGRDVILIFVESYGRSAIEDSRYAPTMGPRLAEVEQQLQDKGFASVSRWITSPTVAGLSWLAHGTFLSGLWVDNQARYDRLMMSDRPTLNKLFSEAGWQSVGVMPAITMDWPEAAYYGYDRVLAARDLGYRGKPFNWVTMPDQYTLSALQRQVRDRPDRRPVMAEVALISSHAPWTPVASLVNWNAVGDGTIFDTQATSGPTPQEVWSDPDRVRQHYIRTVDYSLQTIGSYIATYGGDALFIVIGDHQPASLVTGPEASRAVPMHVISRDAALLARFKAQGFTDGLHPRPDGEMPMSAVKDLLIEALSRR